MYHFLCVSFCLALAFVGCTEGELFIPGSGTLPDCAGEYDVTFARVRDPSL